MKTRQMNRTLSGIFMTVLAVIMTFSFTSCVKKIPFLNSSVVPAAKGYIIIKKDNNSNYTIKVEVSDLAEVERVETSKTTYVVWMETDEGNVENLGQLNSSTSLFSKRHTASLETVSSFKPVKIFITTEEGINVQYPGRQVALATDEFKLK